MAQNEERKRSFLICLFLLLSTFAVYWPVTHYGFINFDDADYVTENPAVLHGLSLRSASWAFAACASANWHPLTWLSHMLDCQLFGLNASHHHLTSLLFHIVNSLLLFFVFKRVTGAFWRSALVAALFALHPCHVESVAWVAERKDVLSTFFFLLTLWAYARYAEPSTVYSPQSTVRSPQSTPETEPAPGTTQPASIVNRKSQIRRSVLWYGLALLFFALGLMSKPMLVTLPFVLLLLDFWPLGRLELKTQNLKLKTLSPLLLEKLPFFALAAASSVATFLVQRQAGAMAAPGFLPLADRLGNAFLAYARYILKLLWPTDLAIYYPHPGAWPFWKVVPAALLLVTATVLVLFQARKRPFLAVGWFWFLGTLVPVIGLVQVGGQSMADRYTYIPSIGFFLIIAWVGAELPGRFPRARIACGLTAALALAACAVAARVQIGYWKNSETLFAHALAVTEDNHMSRFCLGNALIEQRRIEEGLAHLRKAAQLNPSFPNAYGKLGYVASGQGKYAEAIEQYRQALKCQPNLPEALNNLAWLLATCPEAQFRDGREAVRLAERACQVTGYQVTIYIGTLAAAYAEAGRFQEAADTAERARAHAMDWGQKALASRNEELLALYRADKPYHESSPSSQGSP